MKNYTIGDLIFLLIVPCIATFIACDVFFNRNKADDIAITANGALDHTKIANIGDPDTEFIGTKEAFQIYLGNALNAGARIVDFNPYNDDGYHILKFDSGEIIIVHRVITDGWTEDECVCNK